MHYNPTSQQGTIEVLQKNPFHTLFTPSTEAVYSQFMSATARELLLNSVELKARLSENPGFISGIESAAKVLIATIKNNGTIFACGNGGSACEAMHFVEECTARFKRKRSGIKAVHFLDAGTLTCWANDYDFETVFERQVQTFCGSNDTLVLFSTSGNSDNITRAAKAAKMRGTKTLALLGNDGGRTAPLVDLPIIVSSNQTERIQEVHMTVVHILLELIENNQDLIKVLGISEKV